MVEMLQGERLPRALNGRYLKKYFPVFGKTLEDKDRRYLNIIIGTIFRANAYFVILYP
jgi:hypothetical protein